MDTMYETDKWPFVKARYIAKSSTRRDVRVIVVHSIEAPEKGDTAEQTANRITEILGARQRKLFCALQLDGFVTGTIYGYVAKFGFSRKIEFLGAINSMAYRIPHSSKTNFATEPGALLSSLFG